jgi:hypothetical protein
VSPLTTPTVNERERGGANLKWCLDTIFGDNHTKLPRKKYHHETQCHAAAFQQHIEAVSKTQLLSLLL